MSVNKNLETRIKGCSNNFKQMLWHVGDPMWHVTHYCRQITKPEVKDLSRMYSRC